MFKEKVLLCGFLLTCVTVSNSENNFFLAKKYKVNTYVCATNSSYAMSWIVEDITEKFQARSIYKPDPRTNDFTCDIKNDNQTKRHFIKGSWTLNNSVDLHLNEVILDERWEEFPVTKTDFTKGDKKALEYYNVLKISSSDFAIPLSVRIEKEAHIFLCDGENPSKSNCYWFLLQAFRDIASSIRKCKKNCIPSVQGKWPSGDCSARRVNSTHSQDFLSNKKWAHFVLSKQDKTLRFTSILDNKDSPILEWEDPENTISVTNLILNSRLVQGLWKVHNLDFLYTHQKDEVVDLGPPVKVTKGRVCVSMYILMCPSCKIRVLLAHTNQEQTFECIRAGWNRIQFIAKNVTLPEVQLRVNTISSKEEENYWAIDNVRLCQKEEFRYIGLTEEAKCQLLSSADVIKFDLDKNNSPVENKCPENTIGDFCMPCEMIFDGCKQITVCGKDQCVCSAGFQGSDCYYECDNGKYGHGCQKNCGNCYNTCNKVNGSCSLCTNNYSGPKCDIPSSIYFTHPPVILKVSFQEVTVSVLDFTVENAMASEAPDTYTFQYKNAQNSTSNWITIGRGFLFKDYTNFTINNLEPETHYYVRSVIILQNGQWQLGDHLNVKEFTTKCEDITEDNINITSTDTTAFVSLIQATKVTCKQYSVSLFENGQSGQPNSTGTFFENLNPFTNYTVILQGNKQTRQKKFSTDEGVPKPVRNLSAKTLSSTSVLLKWEKPKDIYGEFKHYIVEFQLIKYVSCDYTGLDSFPRGRQTTEDTTLTIKNLNPYAIYGFNVSVENGKYQGPASKQAATSEPSVDIKDEEIPKVLSIRTTYTGARINLTSINCEKLRGPLNIIITLNCTSEWCTDPKANPKTENRILEKMIALTGLMTFSNYSLDVTFCREKVCSDTERHTFTTQPSVPGKVGNLVVYTKNSTSISCKWEPSYPPNGILEKYKIEYYAGTIEIGITPCRIWPHLHCTTLVNLMGNNYYNIQVSAKNQDPNGFGGVVSVETFTQIEQSEPPYDLRARWTEENQLALEWKHPNVTNGDIRFFVITIISDQTKIEKIFNVTNYNLTYYYEIEANKFSSVTLYEVSIVVDNGLKSSPVKMTTISPPKIPELLNEPNFESTNDTITFNLMLNETKARISGYKVYVFKEDEGHNMDSHPEIKELNFQNLKIVSECKPISPTLKVLLGETVERSICKNINNSPLKTGTSYNITIVVINTFESLSRISVFSYVTSTQGKAPISEIDSSLFGLLALFLLFPLVAVIYRKRHDLMVLKNNFFKENNTSREVLDVRDDEVPLAHVPDANLQIPVAKKAPKIKPKPTLEAKDRTKIYSKPIKITEFEEYVKESIRNRELERQHALFPRGQTKSWNYGIIKENKSKNRYNNLIAYDHTRVILEKIDDQPYSDYINANYIDGYKVSKAYIATQGPKPATLNDFWKMIWQENVKYIANLANIYEGGKKKVEKYWPDINETLEFGAITVQHVTHTVFADYEHRVFTVTFNGESRKVEQLHFSSWPDHGVPLYSQSLVPFLQKLLQIPVSTKSPIVVHCSAGVGRTGTILLCDISLRMASRESAIDALRTLQILRDQRPNMVDNIEQYKLAHLVVLECLVGLHTSIKCTEIESYVNNALKSTLTAQMRYLKDTQWQDQAMKTVGQTDEEFVVVPEKNRFEDIIPEIQGRIFISRCPPEDETSSYINAVKVDGFRCPGRFIVTQQPLPSTVGDFWRLVDENTNTAYAVIVSLNEINPEDSTSCSFWPTALNSLMNPVPHITLNHVNTLPLECYEVQIIAFNNWAPRNLCPTYVEDLLSFWEQTNTAGRGASPIFVTCYDGVTASGLFVALSFIIEKMKLEQICDVCQAVRNIRHNRPQFVQKLKQFEFLYKAAVMYINGFDSYANFN